MTIVAHAREADRLGDGEPVPVRGPLDLTPVAGVGADGPVNRGCLVVCVFTTFTDDSGRSDYFVRECFGRRPVHCGRRCR